MPFSTRIGSVSSPLTFAHILFSLCIFSSSLISVYSSVVKETGYILEFDAINSLLQVYGVYIGLLNSTDIFDICIRKPACVQALSNLNPCFLSARDVRSLILLVIILVVNFIVVLRKFISLQLLGIFVPLFEHEDRCAVESCIPSDPVFFLIFEYLKRLLCLIHSYPNVFIHFYFQYFRFHRTLLFSVQLSVQVALFIICGRFL